MGSFLARAYSARYGEELSAVAFLGTCGPIQRSLLGIMGARAMDICGGKAGENSAPKRTMLRLQGILQGGSTVYLRQTAPNTTGSAATTALLTNTTTTRSAGSI